MSNSAFPAHIRETQVGQKSVQLLSEHSRNTAKYASETLSCVGLSKSAYLAGLIHDLGKCKQEFADYLRAVADGAAIQRGKINHTFASVRYLLSHYHGNTPERFEDLAAEILAYAVGAHHGLFDCVSETGLDGFTHRMEQPDIAYDESVRNFLRSCASAEELDGLFQNAVPELQQKLTFLQSFATCNSDMSFYGGLLSRLLLSAVIEGDRRDTAEFMLDLKYPDFKDAYSLWRTELSIVEEKLSGLSCDSPVERARRAFSDMSAELARRPTGIYRLSLPTGAGKTLSSLRAALAHAYAKQKKRIIFVIPLLSVLDQNAVVIRKYLENDGIILEHHSNLISTRDENELDERELLMENWHSPVVITTLVQLLNTLFEGKTSCIRRMQALCDCVLVIDEIQSVPPRFLTLFNLAMNFLSGICGTTVLFCSATQPVLEKSQHPLVTVPEEIIPYDQKLWSPFRRTALLPPRNCKLGEFGAVLPDLLGENDNMLLVCNTKSEAAAIYQQLTGIERYHLSTSMCMAHRREVLQHIEQAKEKHHRLICVSTQIIECGVDISFRHGGRILAGLDNILQTAGRCNRNGTNPELAEVRIFRCTDEKLTYLNDINDAKKACESLLDAFNHEPALFDNDLSSQKSIAFYYQKLYSGMKAGAQDGPVNGYPSLFHMLSDNRKSSELCPDSARYWLRQSFQLAGKKFQVFENDTVDLIVPYGAGKEVISELHSKKAANDLRYLSELLHRAKPYTVAIFGWQRDFLEKRGALHSCNGVLVLSEGWYDNDLGVQTGQPNLQYLEV